MWLMSTFENTKTNYLFFVSTFLDWYNLHKPERKNVFFSPMNQRKNVQICLAKQRKKWHTMI